jgi:hypothetical protein
MGIRLAEKLTADGVRRDVVRTCCDLVESEVSAKSGLSGMAIKAGYKVIKTLKPGMIPGAVDTLLPEFADAMQPLYDKSTEGADDKPGAFAKYLRDHTDETADALLQVTDARAANAKNRTVKKTYDRLRGNARDNVKTAVPGLARALTPFL